MGTQTAKTVLVSTLFVLFGVVFRSQAALDGHYYDQTCPQAESIIVETVRNATIYDPKVPARILRMFFHDCFIRGCDASILLDSTPENQAEKDGPPNISVRAYYVIDDAKAKLEKACPNTVSCADVIAMAARDVVTMSGGPYWTVLKGRKDGRVSNANDTTNLPAPFLNVTGLIQSFAKRGLDAKDLVTLSGGHTLGFSHCSTFQPRLHNFSKVHDTDPSMDPNFASLLKDKCPISHTDRHAGQVLDSTATQFDNDYYKQLVSGKGVFLSDQSLYLDERTRVTVESFSKDQSLFFEEFAAAMIKLGNVGVSEVGEVRVNCRKPN